MRKVRARKNRLATLHSLEARRKRRKSRRARGINRARDRRNAEKRAFYEAARRERDARELGRLARVFQEIANGSPR